MVNWCYDISQKLMKQNTSIQVPPPEDPGAKRSDLVVYVFNVVEDEWSFISSITDAVKRFEYISESEDAADAYFMSMGGEKDFLFISPKSMSPEFQTYCKQIMGFNSNNTPETYTRSFTNFLRF